MHTLQEKKKKQTRKKEMGKQMSQVRELVARRHIHTIYFLCVYIPKLVIAQTFSICKKSHKVNFLLCLRALLREKSVGQMLAPVGPTTGDKDAWPLESVETHWSGRQAGRSRFRPLPPLTAAIGTGWWFDDFYVLWHVTLIKCLWLFQNSSVSA